MRVEQEMMFVDHSVLLPLVQSILNGSRFLPKSPAQGATATLCFGRPIAEGTQVTLMFYVLRLRSTFNRSSESATYLRIGCSYDIGRGVAIDCHCHTHIRVLKGVCIATVWIWLSIPRHGDRYLSLCIPS